MGSKINPTTIGAFVVGAIVLLIAGGLLFGGGKFFQEKLPYVLFFDSSVEGLNVGAPVVFRGVQVGQVTEISAIADPQTFDVRIKVQIELAAARAMRFTAVISYESPSRLGPPLVYTTTSEVTLQRPDKLRVITPGDGPASEFYYDGKTMMAFEPAAHLVAVADAPPTIDAALQAAYDTAALYFPFTAVIVTDYDLASLLPFLGR
jgi:hypothetical protein